MIKVSPGIRRGAVQNPEVAEHLHVCGSSPVRQSHHVSDSIGGTGGVWPFSLSITPCCWGLPEPCRRPAPHPGGLWSLTCRRPTGCPAAHGSRPVCRGPVHGRALAQQTRHGHAFRHGLWRRHGALRHPADKKQRNRQGPPKLTSDQASTSCSSAREDSTSTTTSACCQTASGATAAHRAAHRGPPRCAAQKQQLAEDNRQV